jgi:hypothetical protein
MVETKLNGPPMAERIAARLRNSGGDGADAVVQKGTGPTRTITNIHNNPGVHYRPGQAQGPEGRR